MRRLRSRGVEMMLSALPSHLARAAVYVSTSKSMTIIWAQGVLRPNMELSLVDLGTSVSAVMRVSIWADDVVPLFTSHGTEGDPVGRDPWVEIGSDRTPEWVPGTAAEDFRVAVARGAELTWGALTARLSADFANNPLHWLAQIASARDEMLGRMPDRILRIAAKPPPGWDDGDSPDRAGIVMQQLIALGAAAEGVLGVDTATATILEDARRVVCRRAPSGAGLEFEPLADILPS